MFLFDGKRTVQLPGGIKRSEITPQVLAGYLGLFAAGRRYEVPFLSVLLYCDVYKTIREGNAKGLTIVMDPAELDKFMADIERIKNLSEKFSGTKILIS